MTFEQFKQVEKASRDTIDVKRIYVDMAEDLVSGILLSQIIYWHLPDRNDKTKLRVNHEGYLWIAKMRSDWWEECRITEKQYDRAISILEEKHLVVTDTSGFNGKPTKLIRLDEAAFMLAYQAALDNQNRVEERCSPKVNNDVAEKGTSNTETTTETKRIIKKGVSPDGKNGVSRATPDPAFGKAFTELSGVIAMTPSSIDKFQLLWDDFPDLRRHARALESLKAKQDPNYNYYETVFRNFNPDFVKPAHAPAPNRPASPPALSPDTWEERAAAYAKKSADDYYKDRPDQRNQL